MAYSDVGRDRLDNRGDALMAKTDFSPEELMTMLLDVSIVRNMIAQQTQPWQMMGGMENQRELARRDKICSQLNEMLSTEKKEG